MYQPPAVMKERFGISWTQMATHLGRYRKLPWHPVIYGSYHNEDSLSLYYWNSPARRHVFAMRQYERLVQEIKEQLAYWECRLQIHYDERDVPGLHEMEMGQLLQLGKNRDWDHLIERMSWEMKIIMSGHPDDFRFLDLRPSMAST